MMQIGEAIAKANEALVKDKCPFCNEGEHEWPEKKAIDISKIKSKPRSLKCGDLSPTQSTGKYGRARHHLIPVHQCYTKLHRIAAMGQSVGYDINGMQNGIPLPTVWNKYNVDGIMLNFGEIKDENKKNEIRSSAMSVTGSQWHVGNHHFDDPQNEDSTEEMDDEGDLDHHPYDEVILWKLIGIADNAVTAGLCKTQDQTEIKNDLDELCKEIRDCLNDFKNGSEKSYPYYVSEWAMKFKKDDL